jgi:RNA polymerase sigma-70 factor (TIGR02960 family)
MTSESTDQETFSALVQPFRNELRLHCYRMLGSYQDAEDALQETLLAAWRNLGTFEHRSSMRTWLYRIATNQCLNARRSSSRREARESGVPPMPLPAPTRLGEIFWLEPTPDAQVGAVDESRPDVRYEQSESISLAFVTALQHLPPRQVAVLLLRDVLGFRAGEVAEMLDATVDSVNSALKRARRRLHDLRPEAAAAPTPGSAAENDLVGRFVSAYESGDIDGLVELFTDDVFFSMPPLPHEYQGREAVGEFFALLFEVGRVYRTVPTRANGQPAFGLYARAADGVYHGTGFMVLALADEQIAALTRFETTVLPWFGLPRSLR